MRGRTVHTNIDEWRDVAIGSQPGWEWRSEVIAKFLRSSDIVMDIGAGDQKLKRHVPASCTYIPVDCVDDLPGTFIVDFNTEFRLPEVPFTVAVCAGSLEYINDLAGFFLSFSEHAPGKQVIFTYLLDPAKADRKKMKTHNHFTDLPELLANIGFAFSHLDILATRKHTVFIRGTLSNGAEATSVNRKSLNELLFPPETSRINRFFTRISRSVSKRIRRVST